MKKLVVSFIGAGNVGSHLARQLTKHVTIGCIFSKSGKSAAHLAEQLGSPFSSKINDVLESDLVIVAVNDLALQAVAKQLGNSKDKNPLIVHTAGSVSANVLSNATKRYGVFYPLQTFTQGIALDFSIIPICVNANNQNDLLTLIDLANCLSDTIVVMSDQDRSNLHLGAVMVNNFTNHLVYQCQQMLNKNGLDFQLLLPLLQETIRKIVGMDPYKVQTGPARRGDDNVIEKHLNQLSDHSELYQIYDLFTRLIKNTYENHWRD